MQKDKEVTNVFKDYYIEDDWVYANDGKFIVYRWAETTWNSRTHYWYLNKGYKHIKNGQPFTVDICDLTNGSNTYVLRRCPRCNDVSPMKWHGLYNRKSTYCLICNGYNCSYTIYETNEIMSTFEDQRLIVISDVLNKDGTTNTFRKCKCTCGNIIIVNGGDLTSDNTRSCGCRQSDIMSMRKGDANSNWQGGQIGYYGEGWKKQRRLVRKRDKNTCQRCGITKEKYNKNMDVHHIIKFRMFDYIVGENRHDIEANSLDNLICLCRSCHMLVESNPEKIDDFRNEKGEIENG